MKKVKKIIGKATETPRARRISMILFVLLCLVAAGLIFYWNAHKKSLIRQKLSNTVTRKSNGLYNLSYRQFELDEVAGNLSVSDIHLDFDSARLAQLRQEDRHPSLLFRIYIPQMRITGVQTPRALLEKEIAGSSVEISSPMIELIYTGKGNDSTADVPPDSLYRAILGKLNLVKVDSLSLNNVTLNTRRWHTDDTALRVKGLYIRLGEILIDSNSGSDPSRFLFARQMELTADHAQWQDEKQLYHYQVDTFKVSLAKKNLTARRFIIRPQWDEEAFMKKVGLQIDRFDIRLSDIQLRGWNIQLATRKYIAADSLKIDQAQVKVYKDHHQPRDQINRVGTFPHQALQRLRYKVNIPDVHINDAFVEYKQNTPKSGRKGKVQFYHTTLQIDNFTNDSLQISKHPFCVARASSSFMNLARLNAVFRFNLARKDGSFNIEASLGRLEAPALNSITEPLAVARIESGLIHSARIHIAGNDYSGSASIDMKYEKLKVSVLSKDKETGELDKKGLISLAANMIIKNDNPGKDGKLRLGRGRFERDINRGFFNLVWKSLYVAIADTMGASVKEKPEQVKVKTSPRRDSIPRPKKQGRTAGKK